MSPVVSQSFSRKSFHDLLAYRLAEKMIFCIFIDFFQQNKLTTLGRNRAA
jgi:hypothetical protein